jgi:hypothetical protein
MDVNQMIILTISLEDREDFCNDEGEMQNVGQAALDSALSALEYDGFQLASALVSTEINDDVESTNLVIDYTGAAN